MASYTIAANEIAAHDKTLVAATVDTVTFTDDVDAIEVVTDGAARLYYTVDGSTPTVGGANTRMLSAAISRAVVATPSGSPPAVKLISAGTPTYSVQKA